MIDEAAWEAAVAALRDARAVALGCHVGPDGDALGSMLAMAQALKARGVEVWPSFPEPFVVPRTLRYLPGVDLLVAPGQVPPAPDLMITFDCGQIERLGSLVPAARAASALITVDHHASGEGFGTVRLIDPAAAASAVICRELLARLDWPLDPRIATCLYTGLLTDTGRFAYRNTTPEIHLLASELLAAGVDQDAVARELYSTEPFGYLKVAGRALERLQPHAGGGFVFTWVTRADLESEGIGPEDIDGLIELARMADSHDVAAVFKEQADGRYKVSMRSKGATDVGALCMARGGGGHSLAAGYTSTLKDPLAVADEVASGLHA